MALNGYQSSNSLISQSAKLMSSWSSSLIDRAAASSPATTACNPAELQLVPSTIPAVDNPTTVDYTPYQGMALKAWPGMTLVAGEVVWDGKDFHRPGRRGRFLRRDAPSLHPRRVQ